VIQDVHRRPGTQEMEADRRTCEEATHYEDTQHEAAKSHGSAVAIVTLLALARRPCGIVSQGLQRALPGTRAAWMLRRF
jgi:hypothetical protein